MASTARYKRLGKLTWIEKMISSSRSLTLYIPFFDQLQKKFQVFSRFLVERALKICKKILKIWKKSGSRVNTWGIQKKRPKKSWTSKKIQTHEFVGKNNKKTASGGLRPPSGGPSGHLETPKGVSSYVAEKVVRLWCNHFLPSYPNLRQILDQRRRRRKDFFWNYNILLFVTKKRLKSA